MYDLEQNGLIKYSPSENEFAIEPCITSFTSTDDVVHKGNNCDTPLDELCFEIMTKKQISEAIARNDSLITLSLIANGEWLVVETQHQGNQPF